MKLYGLMRITADLGWINSIYIDLYVYDCKPEESICGKRFLITPQRLNPEEIENPKCREYSIEFLDMFYRHKKVIYVSSIEEFEAMLDPDEQVTLYTKFEEKEAQGTYIVPDPDSGIDISRDLEKEKVDKLIDDFRKL